MTATSAEPTRRDFLYIATGTVAAVGGAASLVPLIAQMNPDASTIAAGAPVEVDLGPIAEGQVIKVFWRGKPIFISHRTKKEIDEARSVQLSSLPDPEADKDRVKDGHDQWLILIGIGTHLGCIPLAHSTTAPAASGRVPLRRTSMCPPINSSPIPRSGSAKRIRQKSKVSL